MATIFQTAQGDFFEDVFFRVLRNPNTPDVNYIAQTATAFEIQNATSPGLTVAVTGAGFDTNFGGGDPSAGVIASLEFFDNTTSLGTLSGLSIAVADFAAAVVDLNDNANDAAFDALLDPLAFDYSAGVSGVSFEGRDGPDTISGSNGQDTLGGGAGNDSIAGGFAGDTLAGGAGSDTLDGGSAVDVADFDDPDATQAVNIDLSSGSAVDGFGDTDVLISIEGAIGTRFDDTLLGDVFAANILDGAEGDDSVAGGDSGDTISGGPGADTLEGGAELSFGRGDVLDYGAAGVTQGVSVDLGSGTATDGFNDVDQISGFEAVLGTDLGDTLIGDAGPNFLDGRAGSDSIAGGDAGDTIRGGDGADTLDGGVGFDTLDFNEAGVTQGVSVDLSAPTVTDGFGNVDTISSFEGAIGTLFDDTLIGDNGVNTLEGLEGDDSLFGGGGVDSLIGGFGSDTLDGGTEDDFIVGADFDGDGDDVIIGGDGVDAVIYRYYYYFYKPAYNPVDPTTSYGPGAYVNLAADIARTYSFSYISPGIYSQFYYEDTISGIENVYGSYSFDQIFGDENANYLFGSGGDDTLGGRAGGDDINGGGGDDIIVFGGLGETQGVDFAVGDFTVIDAFGDTDTVSGIEGAIGSGLSDSLTGDGGANFLGGGGGDDTLEGGDGDDTLEGGAGADRIVGGDGFDVASFSGATQGLLVSFGDPLQGFTVDDGQGQDTLIGVEGLEATAQADNLIGGQGNNILSGLGGDDTLRGYFDSDTLIGGAGADRFYGGALGEFFVDFSAEGGPNGVNVDLPNATATDTFGDIDVLTDTRVSNFLLTELNDDFRASNDAGASVLGFGGDDILDGNNGADTLEGGDGFDTITGGAGDDSLIGGADDDDIEGGDGADTLDGGDGDDTLFAGGGDDSIIGGDGFDLVVFDYYYSYPPSSIYIGVDADLEAGVAFGDTYTYTLSGVRAVQGSNGDDTLLGDSYANALYGGGRDDRIGGRAGDDSLYGEGGFDILVFGGGPNAIDVDLSTGTAIDSFGDTDTFFGFEGAQGTAFGDTILGDDAAGEDLFGGDGDDSIDGRGGDDSLLGEGGADILFGGDGADTLDGGSGADTFVGGDGVDSFYGDADDVLDFSQEGGGSGVVVNVGDGDATDSFGNTGESISGVRNFILTDQDDEFGGSGDVSATVEGGAGNDTLVGDGNIDVFAGGAGNDSLVGGFQNDSLSGGADDDTIDGGAGDDTLLGEDGADTIDGGAGGDSIDGGLGDDTLRGGRGVDTIIGGDGFDIVDYEGFNSSTYAGADVDLAAGTGSVGYDSLAAETDDLSEIEGVDGTFGLDTLRGDGQANRLSGADNDDTIEGRGGDDTLDGGAGSGDLVIFGATNPLRGVVVDLQAGTAVDAFDGVDELSGFERVQGTSLGDTILGADDSVVGDGLTGGGGADSLDGRAGDDTLDGGDGDDTLIGGAGGDSIEGGDGLDTALFDDVGVTQGVNIQLQGGTQTDGFGDADTITGVENAVGTDAFGDNIRGVEGTTLLQGLGGNDTLEASPETTALGNATLEGGTGNDLFIPGNVGNVFDGGEGSDTVDYSQRQFANPAGAPVTVDLSNPLGSDDTLVSIEEVIGSDNTLGPDILIGSAAGETLRGAGGDDIISGGGGDDLLDGGADGDAGDTLDYSAAPGAVSVDLAGGAAQDGEGGTDTVTGFENVFGSAQGDSIGGDASANDLQGRDGDDTLLASAGRDTLNGGVGVDVADFSNAVGAVRISGGSLLDNGFDTLGGSITGVEIILGGDFGDTISRGAGDDTIYGYGGADSLYGGDDADLLVGGAGDDTLNGYFGSDTFIGGDGVDNFIGFNQAGDVDVIDFSQEGGGGPVAVASGLITDSFGNAGETFSGIEQVILTDQADSFDGSGITVALGGGGDDTLDASSGEADVTLQGEAGADSIGGGGGNDSLDGGTEDDRIAGGGGNDVIIGGDGFDTVVFDYYDSDAGTGAYVDLEAGSAVGGYGVLDDTDTLTGIEAVEGTAGDDTLYGSAGANTIVSGGGFDIIRGGAGADSLDGGGLSRIVFGGPGELNGVNFALGDATVIDAFGDTDSVTGFNDVVGTGFADTLVGNVGANLLIGGGGDDSLSGGAGIDNLQGGDGEDTISFADAPGGVVSGGGGFVSDDGFGNAESFTGVEALEGSDNTLSGDDVSNAGLSRVDLLAGDDTLRVEGAFTALGGGAGVDVIDFSSVGAFPLTLDLETGAATDPSTGAAATVTGFEVVTGTDVDAFGDDIRTDLAGGAVTLIGLLGDDTLGGSSSADRLDGGGGNDRLSAAAGSDEILGGDGSDTIFAGGGNDTVTGGAGDDVIELEAGTDLVIAGPGNDSISGTGANTVDYSGFTAGITVTGGNGGSFEVLDAEGSTDTLVGIDTIIGTDLADSFAGSIGSDNFQGGDGDDSVTLSGGSDTLDGGLGNDVLTLVSTTGVGFAASLSDATVSNGGAVSTISGFDGLIGSEFADTLIGDGTADLIEGGDGADSLVADGDGDTLRGGIGDDTLVADETFLIAEADGGDGVDFLDFQSVSFAITVDLFESNNVTDGASLTGSVLNVEKVRGGQAGDVLIANQTVDTELLGDGGNDTLDGLGGNDFLDGGVGADALSGGTGSDTLVGGDGVDSLDGGGGFGDVDVLDFSQEGGGLGVSVDVAGDTASDSFGNAGETIGGFEAFILTEQADTIVGGVGTTSIVALGGDDLISLTAGVPDIDAGAGNDTVNGLFGSESILGGDGDDLIDATRGDDTIDGGADNDTLKGGEGNDVIIGGDGFDTADYDLPAYYVQNNGAYVNLGFDPAFGVATGGFVNLPGSYIYTDDDDTLYGIEAVDGTEGDDTLLGDDAANALYGGGGEDIIAGRAGNDTLRGGAGIDQIVFGGVGETNGVVYTIGDATVLDAFGDTDDVAGFEDATGTDFSDTLTGDGGDNLLQGRGGADSLSGGGGADNLIGGDGADTLIGGAGSDRLGDSLLGEDGDDFFQGGDGVDTIFGGAGQDTLSFADAPGGIDVAGGFVFDDGFGNANGEFSGIEALEGSNSTLSGDSVFSTGLSEIDLLDGDDTLSVFEAGFSASGGAGFDALDFSSGASTGIAVDLGAGTASDPTGGAGVSTVTGFEAVIGSDIDGVGDTLSAAGFGAPVSLSGLLGDDSITGSDVAGGLLGDTLDGGDGNDTVDAGDGADFIVGGAGSDLILGGAGNDTVSYAGAFGQSGGVVIDLEAGTVTDPFGGVDTLVGVEHVIGTNLPDSFVGASGVRDVFEGLDGDDSVTINGGLNDLFDGGAGFDVLTLVSQNGQGFVADLREGNGTGEITGGVLGVAFVREFEALEGSVFGDTVFGNVRTELIDGGDGADSLVANGDGDTLRGGIGDDTLVADETFLIAEADGGDGVDFLDFQSVAFGITVDLFEANEVSDGVSLTGSVLNVEKVRGGQAGDTLIGNALIDTELFGAGGADNLAGVAGNDLLDGGLGDDTLDGGGGNDTLIGRAGADQIAGGGGIDLLDYRSEGGPGGVQVDLVINVATDSFGDADTVLDGVEQVGGTDFADAISGDAGGTTLFGFGGADTLTGNTGADSLVGGDGDDQLQGRTGDDTLIGGQGADTLSGEGGIDRAVFNESGITQGANVDLLTGVAIDGFGDTDVVSGVEQVEGTGFDDTLIGDGEANTLSGEGSDDFLSGGGGADRLDGGTGSDTVSYADDPGGVRVDLDLGSATDGFGDADTLVSFEAVEGSGFGDTLDGSTNVGTTLLGFGGGDEISAGDAGASIDGGLGDDNLRGGSGDDTILGGIGGDGIDASEGDDLLDGGADGAEGAADVVFYDNGLFFDGVTLNYTAVANGGAAPFTADKRGQGVDSLSGFEGLHGSQAGDAIFLNDEYVFDRAGDDVLIATGGALFLAGSGADDYDGGAGSTLVYFDDGFDGAGPAIQGVDLIFADVTSGSAIDPFGDSDTFAGIDAVNGSQFDDTLTGAIGSQRLAGGDGADLIDGGADDDDLFGDAGDDTLRGADGEGDNLTGGAGNDTLDGGDGSRDAARYDLETGTGVVFVNLGNGAALDSFGDSDVLIGVEDVVGTGRDDALAGDGADNSLSGGLGADILRGDAGGDTLDGGEGDDILFADDDGDAGPEADDLIGGAGNDEFNVDAGVDLIRYDLEGGGLAIAVDLTIASNQTIVDTFGDTDTVIGGALIVGTDRDDQFFAGVRGSEFAPLGGDDLVQGGAGMDVVSYAFDAGPVSVDMAAERATDGGGGADTLIGVDAVIGSAFDDTLTGDAADNIFDGGAGDDSIAGGAGTDLVSYESEAATQGVTVDLANGRANDPFGGQDTLTGIEDAAGTRFGDVFVGSARDDLFLGLAGSDTLEGGVGLDAASYVFDEARGGLLGIVADLAGGTIVDGFGDVDQISSIERVVGTRFADVMTGDGSDNVFRGLAGDDTLTGGIGFDVVDFATALAGVSVNLLNGAAVDGFGDTDSLTSIEGVLGGDLDDVIIGDADGNEITGRDGADTLDGGAGDDTLRYDLEGGPGGVFIDLLIGRGVDSFNDFASGVEDSLSGFEVVFGTEFGDSFGGSDLGETLRSFGGDDFLAGRGGNDLLAPGLGADDISQLAGADTIEGALAELDGDTITGFDDADGDRLRILDAEGQPLRARLLADGSRITIDVDGDGTPEGALIVNDGYAGTVRNADFPDGPPDVDPIAAGPVLETDAAVMIDLLADANATDPEGDLLSVANVSVTVDAAGLSVDSTLSGSLLTIDPASLAFDLTGSQSVDVLVDYEVVDGFGGVAANTATLLVEGVDGPFTFFQDGDADGFGVDASDTNRTAYVAPPGFVDRAGDADDDDPTVFPGAPEINDFKDNDQDGEVDEDNLAPVAAAFALGAFSERDAPVTTALIQSRVTDPDGDALSLGDVAVVEVGSGAPVAFTLGGPAGQDLTVDPAQFAVRLAQGETLELEIRYGVSDGFGGETTNVGSLTVNGVDGPFTFFRDADADGFGVDDPDANRSAYDAPEGFTDTAGDADDADPTVFPGALEFNDGKDNNQNGQIDETNRAPIAQDDAFTILVDQPLSIARGALLSQARDADGDPLTASVVVGGARNGAVVEDGDSFIYTPDPGFTGVGGFDYRVSDGFGGTDVATVDVSVLDLTPQAAAPNQRVLRGGDGDDLLVAGPGRSLRMIGGPGEDVFVFGRNSGDGRPDSAVILDFVQGEDKIDVGGLPFVQLGWLDRKVVLGGGDGDSLTVEGIANLNLDDFVNLFG